MDQVVFGVAIGAAVSAVVTLVTAVLQRRSEENGNHKQNRGAGDKPALTSGRSS